jgi:two-component system, sensor histidine kinase and response regulator
MSKKVKTSGYLTDILIVEDSPTQAAQIKYLLESYHYKVMVAENGQQALVWLSKHKPSLVISDIVMPEMNGFELCEKIKSYEGTEDIPVILLTSLSDPEEVIEGLSCGADSFITKPFNKEYLVSNIKKILTEKGAPEYKRDTRGIEIYYDGKKRTIRTGPQEVIKFLLNIYQGAIHQNNELIQTRDELRLLNERLEDLVEERTKELKKNEKKILAFNAELEQRVAERTTQLQAVNNELETFSYSVSHDLKAPLRAINGFTGILIEKYQNKLGSDGQRICDVIKNSAVQMSRLIDDLLAFSRLNRSELHMSDIDMRTMANSIYYEYSLPEQRENISFTVQDIPRAFGDPSLIRQIWANLISNAVKFSSKKDHPEINIDCEADKNEIIYSISDNGAGFDMQYADKLFSVFQRLHDSAEFEGTGIGLAIVKRIVNRHGGRVWAAGEPDKGAIFYFSLPQLKKRKIK